MAEQLKRKYHGQEIVSTMDGKPVADSDGWSHKVGSKSFKTLAEAIKHAKQPPKPEAPVTPPKDEK